MNPHKDIATLEGPFEQIASAAAASGTASSSSGGCISVPISTAFAPGAKWVLKKIILKPFGAGAMSAYLSDVHVEWEASVTVDCNCGNPPPLTTVTGTRVWEADLSLPSGSEIILPTNNPFPYSVPSAKTAIDAIIEWVADQLASAGTMAVLSAGDQTLLVNTVNGDKPSQPRDGKWKDDKDPCSVMKRS